VRLSVLDNGHRLPQKLLLGLARLVTNSEPVDVVKVFMYRPEYFGNPFLNLAQVILRGPSDWTVGERELFGAFTSKLNECVF
jgi:hypothetical protein